MSTLLEKLFPKKDKTIPIPVTTFRVFAYRWSGDISDPRLKNWPVLCHTYGYDAQGYIRGIVVVHNEINLCRFIKIFLDRDTTFDVFGVITTSNIEQRKYWQYFLEFMNETLPDPFKMDIQETFQEIHSCYWDIDLENIS